MPLCFCKSHGCATAGGTDLTSCKPKGKNVDPQTFKAHSYCVCRNYAYRDYSNTNLTLLLVDNLEKTFSQAFSQTTPSHPLIPFMIPQVCVHSSFSSRFP